VRNRDVPDFERITRKQIVRQSAFLPIVDEDDPHITEIHIPLESQHVEKRLPNLPGTPVVCEDKV
jgi:hypothetical protein